MSASAPVVAVYFTPFAPPGPRLVEWMNAAAAEAPARLLARLERRPREVAVKAMKLGDVAVLDARPGAPRRPLAFVYAGLSAAELAEAFARLSQPNGAAP